MREAAKAEMRGCGAAGRSVRGGGGRWLDGKAELDLPAVGHCETGGWRMRGDRVRGGDGGAVGRGGERDGGEWRGGWGGGGMMWCTWGAFFVVG